MLELGGMQIRERGGVSGVSTLVELAAEVASAVVLGGGLSTMEDLDKAMVGGEFDLCSVSPDALDGLPIGGCVSSVIGTKPGELELEATPWPPRH